MPNTTVIITGTSRGIGYETAKYFAGLNNCSVYALSRNKTGLNRLVDECKMLNKSSKIFPVIFDFELFLHDAEDSLTPITKNLKHIDILINNAGYLLNRPFDEISLDEAERMMRINFLGPAMLIKALSGYMGNAKTTHIVNISSMGGVQGSVRFPGLSFYAASKAALANLTESLSVEYKNRGIIVNCLALGAVQTEMLAEAFPGYSAPVKPDEMASFVADFAINGYRFMNGKIIPVALSNP